MPHNESIEIRVSDKRSPDVEPMAFEFEPEDIPDTPEKIAAFLRVRSAELTSADGDTDEAMGEEALFALLLRETMREYAAAAEIPPERIPTLQTIANALDGTTESVDLSPEELRGLIEAIEERFGTPERADLTMLDDGKPIKNQPGRIDAHRRLVDGLLAASRKLLVASWREYHAERFPVRIYGDLQGIADEENPERQRALIVNLAERAGRFTKSQFLNFLKALAIQSIGPLKSPRGVISREEVGALSEFISKRMEAERPMEPSVIASFLIEGALNGGKEVSKEQLMRVIEVFAKDVHAVYELANIEWLYAQDSMPGTVRFYWDKFSNPQRAEFLEVVRATYTNEPLVGKPLADVSLREKGEDVSARKQLLALCKVLQKALKADKVPSPRQIDQLAFLIAHRVEEVYDFRTSPEPDENADVAETTTSVGAREEERRSPAERLHTIRQQLSIRQQPSSAHTYIAPIVRELRRDDMAAARTTVYGFIRASVIGTVAKGERITKLQNLARLTFNEADLSALETVIDSEGASTNKQGWELLLRAANASYEFRDLVRVAG